MMMDGQDALRPDAQAADAPFGADAEDPAGLEACDFQWVDRGAPEQRAHLTGQLRWRGFDLGFAADGLLGVDGRLATTHLSALPADMQELVLHHFAQEFMDLLKSGPLADMALLSLQWHEAPLPMDGEFDFQLRRDGVAGFTRGRLTVLDPAGRSQLLDALAALGWPLPHEIGMVRVHLQVGHMSLSPEELAGLEVGDLVWLEDAELAPAGLRVRVVSHEDGAAARFAWIKRSAMVRQSDSTAALVEDVASRPTAASDALIARPVVSPAMKVQRAWLQGTEPLQSLPQPVLSMCWQMGAADDAPTYEGQLVVVGRRLGLRLTRLLRA